MKKENKKYIWYFILIILMIVIDQISKYGIKQVTNDIILCNGMLVLKKVVNTGLAFSINQESNKINILMTLVVFIIIANFIKNQSKYLDTKTEIALSLVIAGGISNLLDRILNGGVIDFIAITSFPIFNIADIIIVIGWFLVIASTIRKMSEFPKNKNINRND